MGYLKSPPYVMQAIGYQGGFSRRLRLMGVNECVTGLDTYRLVSDQGLDLKEVRMRPCIPSSIKPNIAGSVCLPLTAKGRKRTNHRGLCCLGVRKSHPPKKMDWTEIL